MIVDIEAGEITLVDSDTLTEIVFTYLCVSVQKWSVKKW